MDNMEHAIEQAVEVMEPLMCSLYYSGRLAQAREAARALAETGLLAPAPLREEWGSEMRHPIPGRPPQTLHSQDRNNAVWQIEHNPDDATGRIMHRYVSDWMPADPAEGDGSADQ